MGAAERGEGEAVEAATVTVGGGRDSFIWLLEISLFSAG